VLTRTWNSKWPHFVRYSSGPATQYFPPGRFGQNWWSTYEERVFMGDDGSLKYSREDGSIWSFGYDDTSAKWQVLAPANGGLTIIAGASYWTVSFKNGEQRRFSNSSGSLTSIIDRNGNTTLLSYDDLNRLVTVTDPASRHLTFSYNNSSHPYQVTGVSSDVGIALAYVYDDQERLISVTRPDNTVVTLEYNDQSSINGQSLITAVRDSSGKILESHTYDALGRGLTSSRAGGVDAVTVTYPSVPLSKGVSQ
jgi:YD repeat-containing protein